MATRVLALAVLLAATSARAQTPEAPPTPPPAKCDPLVMVCYGFEGWLLTERSWTPGGAAPRDLVGARLQFEVRFKRLRWAGRLDGTGIPGQFKAGEWETVRSAEAHVATAYDWLSLPGGVSIGPAAAIGAAITLEYDHDGLRPTLPKSLTAGIGFRASWPGTWLYAIVGQNQALRGVALTATWQVGVNEHLATVGSFAVGSRDYTGTAGAAVRWK